MHEQVGNLYITGALAALYGFIMGLGGATPRAQMATLLLLGLAFLTDAYSWWVVPIKETSSSLLWQLDALGVTSSFVGAALAANTSWTRSFDGVVVALEIYLITALLYWLWLPTADNSLYLPVMAARGACTGEEHALLRTLAIVLFSVSPLVLALGYVIGKGWVPWVRERYPDLEKKRWHIVAWLVAAYYSVYNLVPMLLISGGS